MDDKALSRIESKGIESYSQGITLTGFKSTRYFIFVTHTLSLYVSNNQTRTSPHTSKRVIYVKDLFDLRLVYANPIK